MQQSEHRHLVAVAPETVGDEARVRDYDQLGEQAQRAFRETLAGERTERIAGLDRGDVVVYTDYYLVR